jgi:tetratricopeptide (TPR) repeat protein
MKCPALRGTPLRESVGALQAERREALEALRDLHVALATTNYDGLIEEVTELPPVTWMDGARVERVLRGDEPGVLHLHGYWREPESVILGIRSYEQVLGNEPAQNIQRTLTTVKTLLFVGCGEGLHDPNFGKLIEWTGRVFAQSEYRRYRLALESEREELQKQHPPEQRLFVISYGQQHSDLAPFLRSLGAYRPHAIPTPHAAAATSSVATLPARPRCFGREAEIEALVKNLLAPRPEPTPILGAPGIGKSTLTLAALHDEHVAAHYGARRYFIRCDGVKSRPELVAALALACGLTPSPTIEPAVLVELAKAPTALAIDNAETPWDADTLAVEEFLALLAGIPGLALIASVRGGQRPMGVSWHESLEPTRLKLPAAREAFLAIAGKKFQTDPRLDDLIQAMDGVPLAIMLLAYQAEGEPSLAPLWQRWQHERTAMLQRAQGQDRLTNIELSYEISLTGKRMTEVAHRLLRLLALLPDGLAHRDLSVAMPDQAEAAAAVLRKAGLGFDEAERLRLLKPLRDYIRDKHLPQPDDQVRLVKHFVQLAAALGAQIGSAQGAEAVQRLTPEAANIEGMFSLALEGNYAVEVTQAAVAWGRFVLFTGLGSTRPLEQAASRAREHGGTQEVADCIRNLGHIAHIRSDHGQAKERYEQALLLYRQVGDLLGEAHCILNLGEIALARSDHGQARERYEQALPLYRQIGALRGEANCIQGLDEIAFERSDHGQARERYEQALPLYRQVGDVVGEAVCLWGLGNIALAQSDYTISKARYEESLALLRQVGDKHNEGEGLLSLGDLALAVSDPLAARSYFDTALNLFEQIDEVEWIGHASRRLARIAVDEQERRLLVKAAREAWESIDRPDLVADLTQEFGREPC